jgi:hypothetical protein
MILYTTPAKIKRDTPLGSAVDEHLLTNYIRLAQDKEILPMLGTKLDEAIKSKIAADALTGKYKILMDDYLVPALVQFTFAMFAPALRVRFSNNAVSVTQTESGSGAEWRDVKPMVDLATNMGEFYRERGIQYILNDTSSFPEYQQNTGSDLYPTTNNYGSTLNLDPTNPSRLDKVILAAYGFKKYL